jgi:hypothetical protein
MGRRKIWPLRLARYGASRSRTWYSDKAGESPCLVEPSPSVFSKFFEGPLDCLSSCLVSCLGHLLQPLPVSYDVWPPFMQMNIQILPLLPRPSSQAVSVGPPDNNPLSSHLPVSPADLDAPLGQRLETQTVLED